ncbi:MAG TPA: ribonuclease T2 [Amaricoccus sp.]|nr:ribonuclease T2 [Amaricoccus sp.]
MIKALSAIFALLVAAPAPAQEAAPDRAGAFDYWLLALTWTPSWCAAEGAWDEPQCRNGLGFTLHGLWPQNESGWPEYCDTEARDPSRRETAAMADVMGSGGLAFYQWKKHGRCSGLSSAHYFATARRLYEALRLPAPGDAPDGGRATAAAIERAVLDANPALVADSVIVTCGAGRVEEVRVCLTRDFAPRDCGPDVLRDACRTRGPLDVPPVE